MTRAQIIGTGSYVPEKVLTNDDLAKTVETSDEWITERTGIRQRHQAAVGEATSDMALKASLKALEMAGVKPEELDLIVVGTITPDLPMPSCAVLLQAKLGAKKAFAFDLLAACAGSIFGLSVASQYIQSGQAKRVLVVGAELLSRITDWTDRNTCVLFGDAAGALVLAPTEEPNRGLMSTHLHTDGGASQILHIPGGGSAAPLDPKGFDQRLTKIAMNGREVYKFAVRSLTDVMKEAFEANKLTSGDVTHVVAHQANLRIIEAVLDRLDIPRTKAWVNIDKYGNTSSASLPISLDEANRSGRIKAGDTVAMMAIGAGMAWGSGIIRW